MKTPFPKSTGVSVDKTSDCADATCAEKNKIIRTAKYLMTTYWHVRPSRANLRWVPNPGGIPFGPVMVLWFLALGALGVNGILQNPDVLSAVNPMWALEFLFTEKDAAVLLMGGVL